MNNSSLSPLMVIFELDLVLWPFWCDIQEYPCSILNGTVVNKFSEPMKHHPDVLAIFKKLKDAGIKIAVIEFCLGVNTTNELMNLYGWDEYISYKQLYREEDYDKRSLLKIEKDSNISLNETMYFSKDKSTRLMYEDLGLHHVYVHYDQGISMKLLDDALKEYETKRRKNNEKLS